ncbi:MAG: YfhO family protein [Acidobacteria bacterium]|nr:YfhO family protein [Acidobacteriota bacterium]
MPKKPRTESSKPQNAARKKPYARQEKKAWRGILLLVALSVLLFLPVWLNPSLNGDDAAQHYWWSKEFIYELGQGNLYPRWLSGAYGGRGSPILVYYPPLPFYAAALFYVGIRDPLLSLYWGCWLGLLVSGITMYGYSRTLLSHRESLLAAAFYMTAHYHLFDFYQRMAQHEFWAFAWVPLLLYGINRGSLTNQWSAFFIIAAAYALLLMTHLPTALMITLVLPIYVLILTRKARPLARIAAGLMLGVGMAAIFLLPFLLEREYLKALGSKAPNQYFHAGFLFENLGQAFRQIPFPSNGSFNLFLLAGDWLAVGFLALLIICTVVVWRSDYRRNHALVGLWVITIFSLLMTTRLTTPLWRLLPQVKNIQFPIRWFSLVSVGVALLVALASAIVMRQWRSSYLQAAALALVIVVNLICSWLIIAHAPLQPEAFQKRISNYTDVREYHPRWWDQQRHSELDAASAVVVAGKAHVTPLDEEGTTQSYRINTEEDALLKFRVLYFPGWQAQVDGQAVAVAPNDEGHLQLALARGEHQVTLRFAATRLQGAGTLISGFSLLIFLATLGIAYRRTRNAKALDLAHSAMATAATSGGKPQPAAK